MKSLFISLRFVLVFTILLGIAYPLLVTGVAQLAFPAQANGSLVVKDGKTLGSSLIGQEFSGKPQYFQGRLSATGDHAYNPMSSGGSNLSVVGKGFHDSVGAAAKAWQERAEKAGVKSAVPQELVTASGSGLDPHIDLNAALWQVPLVAQARGLTDVEQLKTLVEKLAVQQRAPWDSPSYVNVLQLNLALDELNGQKR